MNLGNFHCWCVTGMLKDHGISPKDYGQMLQEKKRSKGKNGKRRQKT